MDEKRGKSGCPKSKRPGCSISRREFLSTSSKLVAGSVLAATVGITPSKALGSTLELPVWKGTNPKSDIFVVKDIPAPRYSLAGGILPPGPSDKILGDAGIEALISLMDQQGSPFFRTASSPQGLVASDSVVVIKGNFQWVGFGSGSGAGRLGTSTDLLKGLIWRILNHPEGFTGEVVVAENHQGENWAFATRTPSNAQDQFQTLADVITVFQGLKWPVSLQDWTTLNSYLLPGGNFSSSIPADNEYAKGNMDDGYVLLNDNTYDGARPVNGYSYPKFRTAGDRYISMRHGLWNGSSYESDRVVLINMPILKKHCMAYATSAWKNLVGFLTIADPEDPVTHQHPRFGNWDNMHSYFWGYQNYTNVYGLIGRQISLIRKPDLNIVDAIWVANENNYGSSTAVRCNAILSSHDPFAVDWYASEYLLRPFVQDDPDWSSLARYGGDGDFRSASVVNQKAAKKTWGGAYPWVDFVADYYGNTPREDEKNQMNVFLASASGIGSLPAIISLLLAE
jgi:hypothetical protein